MLLCYPSCNDEGVVKRTRLSQACSKSNKTSSEGLIILAEITRLDYTKQDVVHSLGE